MRIVSLVAVLLASVAAQPATAVDWERPDVAYAATRTLRVPGKEARGPFHFDHGKERFEMTIRGVGQILIRRPDIGRSYVIMPDKAVGQDMPLGDPLVMLPLEESEKAQLEEVGREVLQGEDVTRYRLVQPGGTGEFWVTDDGILMRVVGEGRGKRFEVFLTDLQRGPQPAELFEPPAGVLMMKTPGN